MGLLIPSPEAVAVSSNPNYSGDPEPGKVLGEVVRVRERIRARRWWYVAESLVMASSLTVFYVAIHSWPDLVAAWLLDRKSTRLNSSHVATSYAVFCLKK